ncbi:MAG: hypothetical protein AB7Q17_14435 [Phycisphaerae bacterium]
MRPARTYALALLAAYPAWLAMLAAHELGHALHAWLSGGRVARVEIPLWGFSRTEFSANPHPQFVAWGGAVWGVCVPTALAVLTRTIRGLPRWIRRSADLFAGFCWVANGAYLGVGAIDGIGDAGDLVRAGAPRATVMALGFAGLAVGLWWWHAATRRHPPPPSAATRL